METKAGQGQSWGALCLGSKGCKQLDHPMPPHCLSTPVIDVNTRLSSFPPPCGSADPTAHWVLGTPAVFLPPACLVWGKGDRASPPSQMCSPHPRSAPGPSSGLGNELWPGWGCSRLTCVGVGTALKGLQQRCFASLQGWLLYSKIQTVCCPSLAPHPHHVCHPLPTPHTLGGPSEAPGCWVKPGQAAAEPAASEA